MWKRALLVGAIGLGASGAVGCAEERAPINRVQPNALAKSFFVGEDLVGTTDDPQFWVQNTVVDVGYGAAQDGLFTSTYAQPVTRIKWEITEDLLIGRITYQRIDFSESEGAGGAADIDGQVAYAFPIRSHFDIQRDYNPSTGEESNVIVENTSDRPWYERSYFRVDWSRNLNVDAYDFDTLSLMGLYGGITYEPLSYWVNDPNHPDAPHFATDQGYFDITNKAFATPGLVDLSHLGWGIDSFPACYLENDLFGGTAPFGNCNPVELTLRLSFRRVQFKDFEPADHDGFRFQVAGSFTVDRDGYARNYGMLDTYQRRYITRYNLWERSHAYVPKADNCPAGWVESPELPGECMKPCFTPESTPQGLSPERDGDGNGTHDECEDVTAVLASGLRAEDRDKASGSRCDYHMQRCTLPYRLRKEVPVVWHYSKTSNPDFYEGTEWAAHEWDVALRVAVQTARYSECARTSVGEDENAVAAECEAKYPVYRGQQEDNQDAIALAREVDDCRAGIISPNGISGAPYSEGRVSACNGLADSVGGTRGYQPGVIDTAKRGEMLVLCHGPIEPNDSPLCQQDLQRLMPEASKSADRRQILPADVKAADCDYHWRMRYDDPAKADASILATCDNGFYARMGDLRFHQVNVIRDPQTPSPWGIYTDSEDPLTGEKIAASINVWSHVNDLWSQGIVDMGRFIKGELSTEEITDAQYVNDWALAAEASAGNGALGTMDRAEVLKRRAAVADGRNFTNGVPQNSGQAMPEISDEVKAKLKEFEAKIRQADIRADSSAMPINRPFTDQRRVAAQGTTTEALLVDEQMMQLAGMNQAEIKAASSEVTAGTGSVWKSASMLRSLNPQIQRDLRQAKENALAARGACILQAPENVAPNSLTGMIDVLERKFENVTWTHPERGVEAFGKFNSEDKNDPWYKNKQSARAEAIRKFLAQRAQYAVMIHEMGHSIGERHNFVSSSNAWGYRPQYWQLRTKNGTVTAPCNDVDATGEGCIGPRYFDPVTNEERDNLIWMFMSSSVMDYAGENSQDLIGLGAFDFHAARFFYGDTMTVHTDPTYKTSTPGSRGRSLLAITDSFGGIVGYQHLNTAGDQIHYSQLNRVYDLIKRDTCASVGATEDEVRAKFKPSYWNDAVHGVWDPVMDGHIVKVNGEYTRCRGQEVDYVQYETMRNPTAQEIRTAGFYRGGKAVDKFGRSRVPYAFATDSWADLGNLAVYRHDNGADAYELFNFFITEQETRHIFDNFRRNRRTFSVRSQSGRILWRYNEKMRDGAKGLGLLTNIYRDFSVELGLDFNELWPFIANLNYPENTLASGVAFDHFSRQLFRPQAGPHGKVTGDTVLRAEESLLAGCSLPNCIPGAVTVPNGATGRFGQFSIGGKPVENALADDRGEYDRDYTLTAGSYYDKLYAPYLLTESVDNFISDSLGDFTDPRYRAVSMADLFPDGYRRLLANGLTGDDFIKAPRVAAANGSAQLDSNGFPASGIGWTTWWTPSPEVCFPSDAGIVCSTYGCPSGQTCSYNGSTGAVENLRPLDPRLPAETLPVDPQVGWEQQKWLIAMTLMYLPENQRVGWIDLMGIWEIGTDNDPEFTNRIELHLPDGRIYVARTYGTEEIFGKTVQRGVGARVLEYANELLAQAYYGAWVNNGTTEWFIPELNPDGTPRVRVDTGVGPLAGTQFADCNEGAIPNTDDPATWADDVTTGCTCERNRACQKLDRYKSLPAFMRQMMKDFRMAPASMKGIYD